MIERQVRQTQRLIEDLSDLVRSSRGAIQLRLQPLDLREMAHLAVEAVQSAMAERRHELATLTADLPVVVDGDADRIQQVMINLLRNAARYTPPGGRISLSVAAEGGEGVLRIHDTGVGIPSGQLREIFELFTQGRGRPPSIRQAPAWDIGLLAPGDTEPGRRAARRHDPGRAATVWARAASSSCACRWVLRRTAPHSRIARARHHRALSRRRAREHPNVSQYRSHPGRACLRRSGRGRDRQSHDRRRLVGLADSGRARRRAFD